MYRKIFSLLFAVVASGSPLSAGESEDSMVIPTVIIGGGVGGGTAAIYLSRAHFQPMVIQGAAPGGALAQSEGVENWPGSMKVRGADLMDQIRAQAVASGAEYRDEEVVSVDFSKRPFTIITRSVSHPSDVKTYRAASCVIATGSKPVFLGIKGEQEYWGQGVSNCAICDGSLYKGKRVGIVGGGDSAVLEALYLANIAKDVDLFVRKDYFRATDETRKTALLALPNLKIHYDTEVKEVRGNKEGVTGVVIRNGKTTKEVPLDGLFLAIGSKPNTSLFKGQIELDSANYIIVKDGQETSVPFVYAIGDAIDPLFRQAISAAGDGARAALAIQSKLSAEAPALLAAYRKNDIEKPLKKMAQVMEIATAAQFEEELRSSSLPLIVDFYATWCAPCKRIAPMLESSAETLEGKYKFLKVNVDEMGDLMKNYQIRAMPTVLLIDRQGAVLERKVGAEEIGNLLMHLEDN